MSDYYQDRANKEGAPVYRGPDNINGGSHWVYPQSQDEAMSAYERDRERAEQVSEEDDDGKEMD